MPGIEVTLVGDRLNFFGRMAGPIATTQAVGGVYLIGVDRGLGTPRFLNSPAAPPTIGPNVKWDAIVRILPDGTGFYLNSLLGVTTPLPTSDISIIGNEFALRIGRRRLLYIVMLLSGLLAIGFGAASQLPFAVLLLLGALYSWFVTADSASLTAGAVERALPGQRGATMAMHSLLGFGAASLGPLAFGAVLDAGGDAAAGSWLGGFAILAAGVLGYALNILFLFAERRIVHWSGR